MIRWTPVFASAMALALVVALPACKTDQEGVKSTWRSQYKTYDVSVEEATNAAKAVLGELELKEIDATHTAIDGQATGMTADETKVTINVQRVTDERSEVSVYVGKLGDPELGKEILAKLDGHLVKADAEEAGDAAE